MLLLIKTFLRSMFIETYDRHTLVMTNLAILLVKIMLRLIKLNGSDWELKDVKHVPGLRKNLISVGQLAQEVYTIIFQGDNWKISKGAMTVAYAKKNGTLYLTVGACYSIAVATEN